MLRFLLLFLLTTSTLFAAEKVTIEADSVDTPEESVYHAVGNVKVFQADRTLIADEIFYYKDKNRIKASGNVVMNDNGNIMKCSSLEFDTEDKSGQFINVDAFLPPYHWIKADRIDRFSEYKYSMENVSFSTCDGARPDWSFKSAKADITVGGYLTSKHTTARIKDIPVLYAPYFFYPVREDRQSGFLVPRIGFGSSIGSFVQPTYFWDIDVDQDATFSALLASEKSPIYSTEHRFIPNSTSNIYTYLEYTRDEKRYPSEESGNLSKEDGRFFIYNTSNFKITDSLYLKTYIDTVSDYEYIDDFGKYTLLENYTNNTDTYNADIALYYYSRYANTELRYSDNIQYSVASVYSKTHTYSEPHFSVQKNITELPVFLKYYLSYDKVRHTRYAYNYGAKKETSTDLKYDREHITFNLYKPFDLYVGTFTPSLKLFYTKWHNFSGEVPVFTEKNISAFAKLNADDNTLTRRTYMQEHTFELNKIYKNYESFNHSIYNTITYRQTPKLDYVYSLDHIYEDRLEWIHEYEYSLTNFLTADRWNARLINSQKYLINSEDHRYDLLGTDLVINSENVTFRLNHEYDRYEKDAAHMNTSLLIKTEPFRLKASYTFYIDDYYSEDNTIAELTAEYIGKKYDLALSRSISGKNKNLAWKNFSDSQDVVSIRYKSDCWAFGLSYIRDKETESVDINARDKVEHTVMFTISLRGLGDYQSSFNIDTEEEDPNEI
ncbi:MAG: hypothetical protein C0602_09180 [Denitrovibrio sp.]|nr:MAG: hypothetical protein C0602_09180 [Denitrovibrio sp.]